MINKIQENLNTNFIAQNIIYYEEIDSTQNEAKRLDGKVENGTIIITDCQTSGLGTHSRKWYTGKCKNIAFTLILYPNCNISKLNNITIQIAECIVESIYKLYGYKLQIKSPNDIVYNNKKLGGILTESITVKEEVKRLLIGIGLNINQIEFPEELTSIATSLRKEFKREFEREDIISEFCNNFEQIYLKLGCSFEI